MIRRMLGITAAVAAHAAILLFGGLLFAPPKDEGGPSRKVEVVDLLDPAQEDASRKEEAQTEQPPQEAEAEAAQPLAEDREIPDLAELARLDAAAAAPALDAMSLSALADSLDPALAAGGAGGFFSTPVDLGSGGRIGGTGLAPEGPAADAILSLDELDQRPRALFQAAPHYPFELRRRKIEGSVQVLFVVDDQGRVTDPTIEKATHPEFERAALDAVRQWRFEPAVRAGRKVPCKMRVPLRFSTG
ncbi:MAG TPA: energy transducer TonB [Candidatus Polarisedimenticolia bacterium]|nr:energy transducer TonB [Candidatus Polarisedimenticolia bacterium]